MLNFAGRGVAGVPGPVIEASATVRHYGALLESRTVMSSGPLLILSGYSVAIVTASLLGGWLPALVNMTHTRTQLVMSFVAGLMLGVAMYHLLPHGLRQLGGVNAIDTAVWWVMLGMVTMLLLLRLFHFHQHDFSHEEHDHREHHHAGDEPHVHERRAHPLSWVGVALGLGLHTLIDGIALGASIMGGWLHHEVVGPAGLGVFLAILLHKPLDAMSITSLMQAGGWSSRARSIANIAFAMLCPLGALLFFWGVGSLGPRESLVVGCALAFSAGVFLCISLGDLLPEVHFHSHDRLKLSVLFIVGIALAYSLRYLEPGAIHGLEVLP
jgi:zinc and cadmium transporter